MTATLDQLESMFGSLQASWPYLQACNDVGVKPTIDRLHYLKMAGLSANSLTEISSPTFDYTGGQRALGL